MNDPNKQEIIRKKFQITDGMYDKIPDSYHQAGQQQYTLEENLSRHRMGILGIIIFIYTVSFISVFFSENSTIHNKDKIWEDLGISSISLGCLLILYYIVTMYFHTNGKQHVDNYYHYDNLKLSAFIFSLVLGIVILGLGVGFFTIQPKVNVKNALSYSGLTNILGGIILIIATSTLIYSNHKSNKKIEGYYRLLMKNKNVTMNPMFNKQKNLF